MADKVEICVVCAWRANCQKKFSISGSDTRCPDFSRDLSLDKDAQAEPEDEPKPEDGAEG